MAIGRTFKESFQKALRSLEIGANGFGGGGRRGGDERPDDADIKTNLGTPNAERVFYITATRSRRATRSSRYSRTRQRSTPPGSSTTSCASIHEMEEALRGRTLAGIDTASFRRAKQFGFSDAQLAHLLGSDLGAVRADRARRGIRTTYRLVDTCAAEFEAFTPTITRATGTNRRSSRRASARS